MSWRSNWPVTGRGPWSSAWASSAPTGCTGGGGIIRCSFERTNPPRWQLRTGPRWDGAGGLEGVLGAGPTQHFIIPAPRALMMGRTVRGALELVPEPAELVTTTR